MRLLCECGWLRKAAAERYSKWDPKKEAFDVNPALSCALAVGIEAYVISPAEFSKAPKQRAAIRSKSQKHLVRQAIRMDSTNKARNRIISFACTDRRCPEVAQLILFGDLGNVPFLAEMTEGPCELCGGTVKMFSVVFIDDGEDGLEMALRATKDTPLPEWAT